MLEVTGFLFKEGLLKVSCKRAHATVLGTSANDHPVLDVCLGQKWLSMTSLLREHCYTDEDGLYGLELRNHFTKWRKT